MRATYNDQLKAALDDSISDLKNTLIAENEIRLQIGDLTTLETENKKDLINAINEINANAKKINDLVGDLELLSTTNKDTITHAINELDADIVTNDSEIQINANAIKEAKTSIGDLDILNTTKKDSLVNAINEIKNETTEHKTNYEWIINNVYTKATSNALMNKYVTDDELNERLANFTGDVDLDLSDYAKKSDLDNYATTTSLNSYATIKSVNDTIADIPNRFLGDYALKANYMDNDTLDMKFNNIDLMIYGVNTKIGGELSTLNTTAKTNIIDAINEIANASSNGYSKTEIDNKLDLKLNVSEISKYATTESLAKYATTEAVDTKIAAIDHSTYALKTELDNYATTASVESKINAIDLSGYATKTELNSYATTESVDNKLANISLDNYYTKNEVYSKTEIDTKLANVDADVDLSSYATKAELADYATTASLANYATTTSLSNYATTTNVGTLTNLTTSNKDNIVNAINELDTDIASTTADLETTQNDLSAIKTDLTTTNTTYTQIITYGANVGSFASVGHIIIQYNTSNASGDITAQGVVIGYPDGTSGSRLEMKLDNANPFIEGYKTSVNGVSPYTLRGAEAVQSTTNYTLKDYYTKAEVEALIAEALNKDSTNA